MTAPSCPCVLCKDTSLIDSLAAALQLLHAKGLPSAELELRAADIRGAIRALIYAADREGARRWAQEALSIGGRRV